VTGSAPASAVRLKRHIRNAEPLLTSLCKQLSPENPGVFKNVRDTPSVHPHQAPPQIKPRMDAGILK
jgi:hypothetical protein